MEKTKKAEIDDIKKYLDNLRKAYPHLTFASRGTGMGMVTKDQLILLKEIENNSEVIKPENTNRSCPTKEKEN